MIEREAPQALGRHSLVDRKAARMLVEGPTAGGRREAGRCAAQHLPARQGARDGGDAAVHNETGDQTDQESRSTGPRAAASVTAMDITTHTTYLPHNDPDASLAFYRDTLGFEVRDDVGEGKMRWITVGPADPLRQGPTSASVDEARVDKVTTCTGRKGND
jgi:Glyoxalase/Bleomycin resistance protein/Dioxygenase superfamily